MPTALIVFIALTIAGFLIHLLCMRLLAWRGVTVRRTRFGVTFIFDTEDADGTPVRMLNVNGAFQSVAYATDELWSELPVSYQREQARIISELPRLRRAGQPPPVP